jgi:TP901 family phage tail tape measure protein
MSALAAGAVAGAGMSTIGVKITGDATSLMSALARSTQAIRQFESGATASAGRFATAWKVGLAAATVTVLVLVASLTSAGVAAAGFESRMRNVNTLVRESDAGLASISQSVLEMSKRLPTGANNLAEGLYQVASSGFAGAEGLTVLNASGRAASAGLSSTENAVTAITAVLNAYGFSASYASTVSDILFQTVNLGVVEFDELTGVIGDVVGMAAAAKVPIEDVGAAIATMTLSGVSANEAGTSLNRLLQALIQPSDALATVYRQLGIESGTVALETMGLAGVMDALREATGGSAAAYQQMFPEVRAARGAFALAANAGETYARVQAGVTSESERLGATQRALDEQMLAASNQWKVFTNTLTANAIEVGGRVLPAFTAVVGVLQTMAEDAVPTLNKGLEVTAPLWSTLAQVGGNILDILGALLDAVSPVARGLASIAAGATLTGLRVLAASLEAVTGFLAEHPALVVTVAALWASRYLPSITAVASGLRTFGQIMGTNVRVAITGVNMALTAQQVVAGGAHAQVSKLRAAMALTATGARSLTSAFVSSGLATAGLTIGIMAVVHAATTGADQAKAAIAELTDGITVFTGADAQAALAGLRDIQTEYEALARQNDSAGMSRNLISAYADYQAIEAAANAQGDLNEKIGNTLGNINQLTRDTGIAGDELIRLAEAQGFDLSMKPQTEAAQAARDNIIGYLRDIEHQTGVSTGEIESAVGGSIEEWEAFGKAIEDATTKAQQAAIASLDVVGSWKPGIGVQEEADAVEALADARERLRDLESDEGTNSASLKAARESVVDAEERLTESQQMKAEGTLESFYRRAIELGDGFSRNLTAAVEMGLDPAVVGKLLAQGPEQAGPILEQLVGDHSGRLIEMVNESERAIGEITGRITEQARLTAMAVNSTTDQMARDLPAALSISTLTWEGNTPEEIAAKLGLDQDRVRAIAEAFGITIAQGIQAGFETAPGLTAWATDKSKYSPRGLSSAGQGPGFYNGGIYPGYTPGRDIGFIGVSGGEAIMRPEWTMAVGPSNVNRWNALARSGGAAAVKAAMAPFLGGFAGGGVAGAYQSPNPQVISVPVQSTHRYYSPISVGQVVAGDVADFQRQVRQVRARENRIGG